MDAKTLRALQGSIRKWEKIVAGKGVDLGYKNCPLCVLFFERECGGCPVSSRTQTPGCFKTPYEKWENHFMYLSGVKRTATDKTTVALAQKELNFLKSLLPKTKP